MKVKEKSISEHTERNYENNVKNQSERKRAIVSAASEEMQRLYRMRMATVDYRNGKLVRI
jgi:Na+/phosphate symporter